MTRIAKFHKVSPEQFAKDWKDTFPAADDKEIQDTYEKISLPVRATAGSAGYDFFVPADIVLNPGETAKIPTGVRVEMEQDWVLKCYPRSGLGFKFRLQLNNTVGIIDSDYFYSDNEGHIFAKITNDSNEGKTVNIQAGTGFMQGIFVEYGITVDDEATGIRNGRYGLNLHFVLLILQKNLIVYGNLYSRGSPAASALRALSRTTSKASAAFAYSSSLSMLARIGSPVSVRENL